MKIRREVIMKIESRLKLIGIAKLLSLFIPLILLISIVFPTYSIFGYQHSVLSSTDPNLYITITEMPLFIVISDNYYPILLKVGYISLFVVEILSAICCLAWLSVFIFEKKKVGQWLFNISNYFLIILSVFVIFLFYTNPLILGISLVCLLISIGSAVLRTVIKIKNPHLHSVHGSSTISHLDKRGDADGTAQENRIEAKDSMGWPGGQSDDTDATISAG